MSENTHNFTINQGETLSKIITWRDSSGALVDLAGATARMHLCRHVTDSEPAFILTTENSRIILGGALGTITLSISASDTSTLSSTYVYDLELVNGALVKRLLQGVITVSPEVTK